MADIQGVRRQAKGLLEIVHQNIQSIAGPGRSAANHRRAALGCSHILSGLEEGPVVKISAMTVSWTISVRAILIRHAMW